MTSVPLHPALVHIPLGLAFVLPVLALGFSWALWKKRVRPRAWALIVLLQAILLGGGLLAMNTGQREEQRVESAVPETALERHEAYAEQFLWLTGITLAVAGTVVVLRRPIAIRVLTAMTVAGTFAVAGSAFRVGHAGGQLVYVHNAAAAYSPGIQAGVEASQQLKKTSLDSRALSGDDGE